MSYDVYTKQAFFVGMTTSQDEALNLVMSSASMTGTLGFKCKFDEALNHPTSLFCIQIFDAILELSTRGVEVIIK